MTPEPDLGKALSDVAGRPVEAVAYARFEGVNLSCAHSAHMNTGQKVDDFHPLRYRGEFWVRYFAEYEATCARFYIYPRSHDRAGREVTKGEQIAAECRELLESITFSKR